MKIIFCLSLHLLLVFGLPAQEAFYSFEHALHDAKVQEKPILMVFAGSDWCKPCIKLKKEILESDEFSSYRENLILLYLDFPFSKKKSLSKVEREHNDALASIYNKEGTFPKVLLVDHNKNILNVIEYTQRSNPESFIQDLAQ